MRKALRSVEVLVDMFPSLTAAVGEAREPLDELVGDYGKVNDQFVALGLARLSSGTRRSAKTPCERPTPRRSRRLRSSSRATSSRTTPARWSSPNAATGGSNAVSGGRENGMQGPPPVRGQFLAALGRELCRWC